MKIYAVSAMFPGAPAAHAFQECRIIASGMGCAANRGLKQLRERPHIKGRHLESVRLTVTCIGEAHEAIAENSNSAHA